MKQKTEAHLDAAAASAASCVDSRTQDPHAYAQARLVASANRKVTPGVLRMHLGVGQVRAARLYAALQADGAADSHAIGSTQ